MPDPDTLTAAAVAILTGHEWPVLPACGTPLHRRGDELRSSPATSGQCCQPRHAEPGVLARVAILTGHEWPVLRCREPPPSRPVCCDPHRPRVASAARRRHPRLQRDDEVAILTGHEWPVLRGSLDRPATQHRRCDPHRPRVASAAGQHKNRLLAVGSGVAILTGHEWPVLHAGRGLREHHRGRCDPHRPRVASAAGAPADADVADEVAILTGHEWPVLLDLDQGSRVGREVAILTGHEWPVLHHLADPGRDPVQLLRSSPATSGQCCGRVSSTPRSSRGSCDPHRPRVASAATRDQCR